MMCWKERSLVMSYTRKIPWWRKIEVSHFVHQTVFCFFVFFTAERPAPEQRGTVPNSVPNPWSHILALFPLPIESYCNYVPLLNFLSFSFKKTKQGNVGGARITQIPNRSNHRMVLPDTPASLLSYSFRILLCPLYEATSEFYHMISWFGFILLV